VAVTCDVRGLTSLDTAWRLPVLAPRIWLFNLALQTSLNGRSRLLDCSSSWLG
jgi:hypothetical protein